jgi:ABC-type nitrate/sulfonate/bicarbonate transport system substrate-binding protein
MKLHKAALFAAALAASLAAGGPSYAEQEEATFAVPALTITFTPLYVASEAGFWKKAGLDVKEVFIVGMGSTNALLAGSVDFAISSGPTLIRSNIRGQKIVAIAGMSEGLMFETVVRKEVSKGLTLQAPIAERARALRGLKIAVDGQNTVVHGFLRYFARKGGVDPEKEISVVAMQPEAVLAAMKTGSLDLHLPVVPDGGAPGRRDARHRRIRGFPGDGAVRHQPDHGAAGFLRQEAERLHQAAGRLQDGVRVHERAS